MASLADLPAPVLHRVVAMCLDVNSSDCWRSLSLVCKGLNKVSSASAVRSLKLECTPDLASNGRRCMERSFSVDALHLVAPSDNSRYPVQQVAAEQLLALFQLPLWQHLRCLRMRDLVMPEAVLQLLPQASPHLQELFLEGIAVRDAAAENHNGSGEGSNNSMILSSDGANAGSSNSTGNCSQQAGRQQQKQQAVLPRMELPAVTVCLPRQIGARAVEVHLCSPEQANSFMLAPSSSGEPGVSTRFKPAGCKAACSSSSSSSDSASNGAALAAAHLASILAQLKQLRVLRMDCPLAQPVMLALCKLHRRPCVQDTGRSKWAVWPGGSSSSSSSSSSKGAQSAGHHSSSVATHGGGSSGSSGASTQPLLVHMPLLGWYLFNVTGAPCAGSTGSGTSSSSNCASSVQPAAMQAVDSAAGGVPGTSGAAATRSSASVVPASSGSSSSASSGAACAAAQQAVPGPQPASDTSAAHAAGVPAQQDSGAAGPAAPSLVHTSSICRRSLDLLQPRTSLTAACTHATAAAGVAPAAGAGADESGGSSISGMTCTVSLGGPSFSCDAAAGCCSNRCRNSSSDACCTSTSASSDCGSCCCNGCDCLDGYSDAPSRRPSTTASSSMSALNKTDVTTAGGAAAVDRSDTGCKDQ